MSCNVAINIKSYVIYVVNLYTNRTCYYNKLCGKIINICINNYIIYLHVHDGVCFSSCCNESSAKYGCLAMVFVLNLGKVHWWVFSTAEQLMTGEDYSDSPRVSHCLSWHTVLLPGIFPLGEQHLVIEE